MRIEPGSVVDITWNDTRDYSDLDWNGVVEDYCTATMRTHGVIVREFKSGMRDVIVGRDFDEEDESFHGIRAIPAGCIVSCKMNGEELWDVPEFIE